MTQIVHTRKAAQTRTAIHPLISNRWSPRSFKLTPIPQAELDSLFEAARWAPSAMNEQPWRFIYAFRGEDSFDKILESFNESNSVWARHAPVLMLTLVKKTFSLNGAPNRSAHYDLGQAVANMGIQATDLGIGIHQIGGFSHAKATSNFNIPEGYEVVTGLVLGYYGDPRDLPENLRARELAPRKRNELSDIAFHGDFQTN